MPGIHKYKTISFRPSESERQLIEARAKVSGMNKKDFIAKSCIYSNICVVGSPKNIQMLVLAIQDLRHDLDAIASTISTGNFFASSVEFEDLQMEYLSFIYAITEILDSASYLFPAVTKPDRDIDECKAQMLGLLECIQASNQEGTKNSQGAKKVPSEI